MYSFRACSMVVRHLHNLQGDPAPIHVGPTWQHHSYSYDSITIGSGVSSEIVVLGSNIEKAVTSPYGKCRALSAVLKSGGSLWHGLDQRCAVQEVRGVTVTLGGGAARLWLGQLKRLWEWARHAKRV